MAKSDIKVAKKSRLDLGPGVELVQLDEDAWQLGIDVAKVTLPTQTYTPNWCTVRSEFGRLCLLFGERSFLSSRLQTMLNVQMSPKDVGRWLAGERQGEFHDQLRAQAEAHGGPVAEEQVEVDPGSDPKVHTVAASICAASYSEANAELDFFNLSPATIRRLQTGSKSPGHIEPVVRVMLSVPLLLYFIDLCRAELKGV